MGQFSFQYFSVTRDQFCAKTKRAESSIGNVSSIPVEKSQFPKTAFQMLRLWLIMGIGLKHILQWERSCNCALQAKDKALPHIRFICHLDKKDVNVI